ncbi:porin family protein [Photobacterium minamisatsumaniensis]|uniref:porin family protein n=1 Tax=Photobacterium minamisatsumaniensis TaxID=2910233 RepID=UPI003D0EEDD2
MKKTIIATTLSTIAFGAAATENKDEPYVFIGLGKASESSGFSATAGVDATENFALELSVHKNSDSDSDSYYSAKLDWWTISLTPALKLPLNEYARLYAKGGVFVGGGEITVKSYRDSSKYSDSTLNLTYGAGIEFMPIDNGLSARVSVDWYNFGDMNVRGTTIDVGTEKVINFMVGYKF